MPRLSLRNFILKKARGFIRKNFARIPDGPRAWLERRLFQIHLDALPSDLVFKIADTKEELEQAFRLLHDSYVREGYMVPDASGLRVTPYHAIPTTTTLIAKQGDRVLGTVSLIRQSSLKLPVQSAFDLSRVVSPADQVVEISSLAIDPKARGQETQLLFWLSKYVFEYCQKFFAADFMFVTINPRQVDLYENIILFKRFPAPLLGHYGFANGAPAVAEYIDMREYENRLIQVYWNAPPTRNVYTFIMRHKLSRQFKFPQRPVFTVNDPVMTPELLDYFFNRRTSAFANMTEEQIQVLHEIYREFPQFTAVLPKLKIETLPFGRRQNRYQVSCPASFTLNGNATVHGATVTQVSETGFLARVQHDFTEGDLLRARVQISHTQTIEVVARVVWSDRNQLAGFALVAKTDEWSQLIGHLRTERNNVPDRRGRLRRVA